MSIQARSTIATEVVVEAAGADGERAGASKVVLKIGALFAVGIGRDRVERDGPFGVNRQTRSIGIAAEVTVEHADGVAAGSGANRAIPFAVVQVGAIAGCVAVEGTGADADRTARIQIGAIARIATGS